MNRIILLIALVIVFLSITTGATEEKVKIAVIFGQAAYTSSGIKEDLLAARFAVEDLNRQGGLLGRQVELIELDNKNTPLGSRQAAKQAVEAGVIAVLGPFSSSHTLLAAPVLQEAKIPLISATSTNPAVTLVGDYIFRICFTDEIQGEFLSEFAVEELKAKTAVVITCEGEIYSIELGRIFSERFMMKGGKVLWKGGYLINSTDFKEILSKVKELQPDLVFLPGYDNTVGFIIKQARQMGTSAVFLGGDSWSDRFYQFGGDSVEGGYYSAHWDINSQNEISREFINRYKQDFKSSEIFSFGLIHDSVFFLADAVGRAKSLSPSLIRDALAATKDFHGITGDITMDKDRNPLKPVYILKFENGGSFCVKTYYPRQKN